MSISYAGKTRVQIIKELFGDKTLKGKTMGHYDDNREFFEEQQEEKKRKSKIPAVKEDAVRYIPQSDPIAQEDKDVLIKKIDVALEQNERFIQVNLRAKANDKQVAGNHYKGLSPEPWDVILSWDLDYLSGNAVKYIARHAHKNGKEDIKKAIHYLEKRLEVMEREEAAEPNKSYTNQG